MPAPSFSKSPPQLVKRFDELAALVPGATRRLMFGYPSCTLNGNMFFSLFGDHIILRLTEADRRTLATQHRATVFEPMPGHPMKEYMVIPPQLAKEKSFESWVMKSRDHAATLPAKKPKSRSS